MHHHGAFFKGDVRLDMCDASAVSGVSDAEDAVGTCSGWRRGAFAAGIVGVAAIPTYFALRDGRARTIDIAVGATAYAVGLVMEFVAERSFRDAIQLYNDALPDPGR